MLDLLRISERRLLIVLSLPGDAVSASPSRGSGGSQLINGQAINEGRGVQRDYRPPLGYLLNADNLRPSHVNVGE